MSDVIRSTPVSKQGNGNDSMSVECSGHDRYLLVFINIVDPSTGNRALTISYNNTNLTRLQGRAFSSGYAETEVWGLAHPDEGSHTLAWSFAGAITEYQIIAIPLSQVDPTAALDSGSGAVGTGASASISLTTSADRCQMYSLLAADSGVYGVSASSGETEIAAQLDEYSESHASEEDEVVSPAGSESIGWAWSGTYAYVMEAVAVKPTPNIILHVPQLSMETNSYTPLGAVVGKPAVLAAGITLLAAITKLEAFAAASDLPMTGLTPYLDFRLVVALHTGERRRLLSSEERYSNLTAGERSVVVITEKRNE